MSDPNVRFNWSLDLTMLDRPYFFLCDPYEGTIWLTFQYGYPGCDSVFSVGINLSGFIARPFIWLAGWKWDRAVARQNARLRPSDSDEQVEP